ncbi:MAG: hypothetical protein AAF519_18530 [Bacteroidota bacterium]
MNDDLKDFITKNREAFDDREPSNRVWDGIQKKTSKKSFHWIWKVAAVLFFLSSVILYFDRNHGGEVLLSQQGKISSDFHDIESFYFQMIVEKKTLIQSYGKVKELDYAYEQDLQTLDAMYEVLKDELKSNPSKKVVDALLLNLVVRIDILNKELAKLDENTIDEEESHPEI